MVKYLLDRTILIGVLVALAFGTMWAGKAYFAGKRAEQGYKQQQIESMQRIYKELKDQIARLNSSSVSKHQLKTLIKDELSQEVSKLVKANKEKATQLVVTTAKTKQQVVLDPSIWKHYTNPKNTEAEYYFMKLYKTDKSGIVIPWSWVMYFPNRQKKWKYGFYPLDIKTTTLLTQQKHGGTNAYTQLSVTNNKEKQSRGKVQKFTVSDTDSYVKWIQPKDNQFFFWNPAIDFGAGIYYNTDNKEFVNGIEVGYTFMGYGHELNMDYKFMTLGVGTDFNTYWAFLRPFSINLTKLHIPLIHHLYFAPAVGYSFDNDWLLGCNLNLEF